MSTSMATSLLGDRATSCWNFYGIIPLFTNDDAKSNSLGSFALAVARTPGLAYPHPILGRMECDIENVCRPRFQRSRIEKPPSEARSSHIFQPFFVGHVALSQLPPSSRLHVLITRVYVEWPRSKNRSHSWHLGYGTPSSLLNGQRYFMAEIWPRSAGGDWWVLLRARCTRYHWALIFIAFKYTYLNWDRFIYELVPFASFNKFLKTYI